MASNVKGSGSGTPVIDISKWPLMVKWKLGAGKPVLTKMDLWIAQQDYNMNTPKYSLLKRTVMVADYILGSNTIQDDKEEALKCYIWLKGKMDCALDIDWDEKNMFTVFRAYNHCRKILGKSLVSYQYFTRTPPTQDKKEERKKSEKIESKSS